jgi:hypothetical protein
MRYCRGTHIYRGSNIADTFLGVAKEPEDAEAGAVAEHTENIRSHKKLLLCWNGGHEVCQVATVIVEMVTGTVMFMVPVRAGFDCFVHVMHPPLF